MSQTFEPPAGPAPGGPAGGGRRRTRWQVGIRTLVLLTAAIAAWMTFVLNRRQIALLEPRIAAMRSMARELLVEDAKKIAVVKLDEAWMGENRWDIHLPPGRYRLCVATRSIGQTGLAPAVESAPIEAGRRLVVLEVRRDDAGHHVLVTSDGKPLVTVDETKGWDPAMGSSESGGITASEQRSADQPVILLRRRFMQPVAGKRGSSTMPMGPTDGLQIWIEPVRAPSAGG